MAARRLLIVMLVLLGISTLAAALVPTPEDNDETETTASEAREATTASVPDATSEGEGLSAEITVGGAKLPVVGSNAKPVRVGDQLALEVGCKCSDLVEIPALGLIEAVAPDAPARFDLLPDSPGSYGIRLLEANEVVGRIEVKEAREAKG